MAALSKHVPSFPLVFSLPPHPSVLLIGKQQFHLPATIWKPPGKYSPISSISILCQLIWGIWGRIPVFCSRGLFCFSIARQIRPLPRYTLHIHPPKRLQAFSICPILDKTTYPGKISEQSKKYHPPKFVLPHIPGTPKTFWGVLEKAKISTILKKYKIK